MGATAETALLALSRATGLALAAYQPAHVTERIRRALEREQASDIESLVRLLRSDVGARSRFRSAIAVSVSGLFRDPAQFELLERTLLPPLLDGSRPLRVWSAGSADGSELYSVALLLERRGALERSFLLGSDLLDENVAAARRGVYGDVAISQRLRTRVRFEQRDLVRDGAPPGRWRLVLCRNVAIYLAPAAKRRLHQRLAGSLVPGGVLLLGRSERVSDPKALELERIAPHAYRKVT